MLPAAIMMDQQTVSAIQGFLGSQAKCVTSIEAGLVRDWVKTSRILVLVQNNNEHGLLVFVSSKPNVTSTADLSVEKAFPINEHFKCEIDTSGIDVFAGADVYVKVTYQKQKLLFELPFSPRTNTFVAEVTRAAEASSLRVGPPPSFTWLQAYVPLNVPHTLWFDLSDDNVSHHSVGSTSLKSGLAFDDNFSELMTSDNWPSNTELKKSDSQESDLDNSENFGNIPRQSIAMGATPLAARESVVKLQMTMREEDYTDLQNFRVFIGTWNVNGQAPIISLEDWLAPKSDLLPPDLYVIGFQELDLSKEAFLFNDTPREEEWLHAVSNALHPEAEYKKVKLVRLIGMMLIIFVQVKHVDCIQNVAAETVGTGIMGKMGNKGGVAVRFDLHSTSVCFINCHLAAHVEEFERRNQDYSDICARLVFNQFKPPKFIKDHQQIYWLGDMNYRIMDLDTDQVKGLIDKQCYPTLLEHDQLTIQHGFKRVFVGCIEGPVRFPPTYKYDPGTNDWDSSEKNRPPAWCDRILWKGEHISQLCYRSHPSLMISDHKPVSSVFEVGIKVVDNIKYRKIYEEVMKKLDKLENEFLPQVTVDKMEVHFERVTFIEPVSRFLTIANTGQVPVQFEFIKKLNDTRYCKDWLNIKPYMSFIMPGEKCDVELEVYVDKRTAFKLNSKQDTLDDILVLHLEGGKDLFITVQGAYIPSCFGSSLDALVRMPFPIREVPTAKLIDLETHPKEIKAKEPPFEIPKELWLLIDHLFKYGLTKEDLFQQPGLHQEIQQVLEKLDTGKPEHMPGSVNSVAEALLLFLEALADSVVPTIFYQRCLDCSNNFILCKQVIFQLPQVHRNVFLYIMYFLKELLHHSAYNKLDPNLLATVFGSILLRAPPNDDLDINLPGVRRNQQLADRKKATFVYHFLMNDW
ncbi:inositol polyphosphate 5-phosphatase OCRL-1-like isoform X1 [Limulus polyphemus]|uniref:Inositol polyphosphate 5-phosphatase OCRL-1-like isoform X1 n=1 Tax=Limulus polyphemus TaxID=6850 RepID=A0ABM1B5I9_LIMPO|nr:inositol polyphosphate 5-phosphatase OCRL-1-like isoform X1 [Limulus polyphemus]XP_022242462.1 inositol polyphosphate 5-phosphatase OCRL-1-like isoform X1 [Limulus polyphemus]XP_022242463.1 inositol polyphosphate 5-phosphatase OCRL-1-like isoform X1 [Limulus polyphemus]